jgi:hypothetical protein
MPSLYPRVPHTVRFDPLSIGCHVSWSRLPLDGQGATPRDTELFRGLMRSLKDHCPRYGAIVQSGRGIARRVRVQLDRSPAIQKKLERKNLQHVYSLISITLPMIRSNMALLPICLVVYTASAFPCSRKPSAH